MTLKTKATAPMPDDELRKQIENIELNIPLISHSPHKLKRILLPTTVDKIMQLFQTALAKREAEVERSTLEKLKYKLSKHFTSWGDNQGNCVPEDVLDEVIASLAPPNKEKGA